MPNRTSNAHLSIVCRVCRSLPTYPHPTPSPHREVSAVRRPAMNGSACVDTDTSCERWGANHSDRCICITLYIYRVGQKSKPLLIYQWIAAYVRKALLFCTHTNSGMTASYIKLFALFVVLNILWYSAANTRMRRSSTRAINTDVQVQFNLASYQVHS